jgi:FKBP-type peptidyl-prolyl cis-trans isomerase FklB
MKKLTFVAIMAIVAVAFTACGNKGKKVSLKDQADSVSFAMGILNSQYIQSMGIDSADAKEFLKGVKDGMKYASNEKKEAYCMGLDMGLKMGNGFGEFAKKYEMLNKGKMTDKKFLEGLATVFDSKAQKMDPMQAQTLIQGVVQQLMDANKAQSEKFMKEIAQNKDVKKLNNGVYYKVIKAGNGKKATTSSIVKLNYEGKTVDGSVFDSSYKRGEAAEMSPTQVIPGFQQALLNMPVGSTWEVYIPSAQAYGEQGSGNKILPNSALIFKIEVLDVKDAPVAAPAMPTNPNAANQAPAESTPKK